MPERKSPSANVAIVFPTIISGFLFTCDGLGAVFEGLYPHEYVPFPAGKIVDCKPSFSRRVAKQVVPIFAAESLGRAIARKDGRVGTAP